VFFTDKRKVKSEEKVWWSGGDWMFFRIE